MNITDPIYTDEVKAREHLEKLLWPDGPICPHCGNIDQDRIAKLEGKSTRPGVYKCKECRKPFSVTVGTLMERSHIPLKKWLAAMHLITASKKGVSAHQMHRMLGITYDSAWFLAHRLRDAMRDPKAGPIGGQNKVVEADETFIGGKAKNRAFRKTPPKKESVMTLVERDGEARSFHIANVTAKTLRPVIVKVASRASYLMTDENKAYVRLGREFAGHGSVNHSKDEYVRGVFWHTNTAGKLFLDPEARHLWRLSARQRSTLASLSDRVRFSIQQSRKISDNERASRALRGIVGKRLTYRRTNEAANA